MNFKILFILFFLFPGFMFSSEYKTAEAVYTSSLLQPWEAEEMDTIIRNQGERLSEIYGPFSLKPVVAIASSVQDYTSEQNADPLLGGMYRAGVIYIEPLNNLRNKNSLAEVLSHEFNHLFFDNKFSNLPAFVNEGLACYYSGTASDDSFPLSIIALTNLNKNFYLNPEGYHQYLASARSFISSFLQNNNKLSQISPAEWFELYQSFYKSHTSLIRVRINPRNEKRFELLFRGPAAAEISNRNGIFTSTNTHSFFIDASEDKFFVDDKEASSAEIQFQDGFNFQGRHYRGNIRLIRSGENLYCINVLPVEDYLCGVTGAEMPSVNLNALKVQAVLSRTLAYRRIQTQKEAFYDVLSLTSDQSYKGTETENKTVLSAVHSTEGLVAESRGKLILPFYSSTCGGNTASALDVWGKDYPFLQSTECGLSNEILCRGSPHFSQWERTVTPELLKKAFGYEVNHFSTGSADSSGRVRFIRMNNQLIPFEKVKAAFAAVKDWAFLKSAVITITNLSGGSSMIQGRGLGHGVGLCQYGAMRLCGKYNWKPEQVLKFYFPGVEIGILKPDYLIWEE